MNDYQIKKRKRDEIKECKLYYCDHCQKAYTNNYNLNLHYKTKRHIIKSEILTKFPIEKITETSASSNQHGSYVPLPSPSVRVLTVHHPSCS